MEWKHAELLIVSQDESLVEVLSGKLRQWGATVHHHAPGDFTGWPALIVDVILIDVRRQAEKIFAGLRDIRKSIPAAEMILINRDDNINASMLGMKAGASDELTVPLDMEHLRRKVADACRRSRLKCASKNRGTLLKAFEKTMSAVAFAQAGEFETAISFMENPAQDTITDHGNTGIQNDPNQEPTTKR